MAFNESYKHWHKPDMSPNAKTQQGYYKLQNPQKYLGNQIGRASCRERV